jgi:nucleolar GTP-binding protein
MNTITHPNVEVVSFPFTTKSLYIGHSGWAYIRWQAANAPGLLNRPREERNAVAMQPVTALAHLRAAFVSVVDISGMRGYSVEALARPFCGLREAFLRSPGASLLAKSVRLSLLVQRRGPRSY